MSFFPIDDVQMVGFMYFVPNIPRTSKKSWANVIFINLIYKSRQCIYCI